MRMALLTTSYSFYSLNARLKCEETEVQVGLENNLIPRSTFWCIRPSAGLVEYCWSSIHLVNGPDLQTQIEPLDFMGPPYLLCLKISDWEPGTDFFSIGPAHGPKTQSSSSWMQGPQLESSDCNWIGKKNEMVYNAPNPGVCAIENEGRFSSFSWYGRLP